MLTREEAEAALGELAVEATNREVRRAYEIPKSAAISSQCNDPRVRSLPSRRSARSVGRSVFSVSSSRCGPSAICRHQPASRLGVHGAASGPTGGDGVIRGR